MFSIYSDSNLVDLLSQSIVLCRIPQVRRNLSATSPTAAAAIALVELAPIIAALEADTLLSSPPANESVFEFLRDLPAEDAGLTAPEGSSEVEAKNYKK